MAEKSSKTAYITRLSLLCAAAVLCSYVETLLPVNIIPLPGFKIGLANVVIMLTLYAFSLKKALLVNVTRCVIVALLFSGLSGAIFSLVGGTLASVAMYAVKKCPLFSIYSVGVAGAVMHNLGQIAVASVMLKSLSVLGYLPWLMLCSLVAGLLIAFLCALILSTFIRIVKP